MKPLNSGQAAPPGVIRRLLNRWTWRMAWRDSRTSRGKLALFSASIVLGIAALAAVGSLGTNLERAIEEQTKALLGADLAINSRNPFTPEQDQWLRQIGGEQSREVSFSTMIFLPRTENTRLVQLRALSGGFPYYGTLETDPASAADQFRRDDGGALVEPTLLQQFDAKPGDPIRIGKLTVRIAGALQKVPGETALLSGIAPRVYIALTRLPATELVQQASLARYRAYFKFPPGTDVPKLAARLRPQLEKFRFSLDTVEERKRELGRSMDNLYHFLNLAGFVALLLGGVGVASAIHVHIKQKLGTVAVLRCLGGSVPQTFAIYVAQGIALGIFGAALGGLLGLGIQTALPAVLADFIPFHFQFHPAWAAVGRAVGIGFGICLLFAVLPLLAVRRVPPLAALRVSFELPHSSFDPWRWAVIGMLAAGVVAFALAQSRRWQTGLGFAAGLGLTFLVLAGLAQGLVLATRRVPVGRLPFTIRQGIANLHRPNNRTLLLLLSLGLGTFLIMSLCLVQRTLLKQITALAGDRQPNAVLFDIQQSQREGVVQLVHSLSLPVLDDTPVINMRLSSVKGRPVESLLATNGHGHGWALRREYRSTYSDHLRDGEKIVAGAFVGRVANDPPVAPISLEQGIAKELQVGLGDELVFDVQGVPVATRITSLREVEWRRIQPNFFVVFPRGVLESAPAMHVLVTHVASSAQSARMQREVVKAFPNVSAIDLTLVRQTVDAILDKISFVIRFMAMFTVTTGFLVLVTALLTSRYQRLQESILLRTLGASRRQIVRILAVEYFLLGFLAALAGLLLAALAAWVLARFVFHAPFAADAWPVLAALAVVPAATVAVGFLMSRGVLSQPPLSVLRTEA